MSRIRSRSLSAVAVATSLAALAACSGGSGGGPQAFDAKVTARVPAATKDVASVRWNLPAGEPSSIDPAASAVESNSTVTSNMCESLFTFDDNYKQQPALATKVDHPDPLTYVVTLREGVTFWDGKPMTSEDVVYSLNRILDPDLASSWAGFGTVAKPTIEATGPLEVTLKLKKPDSTLSNYFATPAFQVVEKDFTEKAGKDFGSPGTGVMCTGPYKLGSWKQGTSITLNRNDDWWNVDNKPKVGSVVFTFTSDPSAQVAALASGDVDGQWNLPTSSFKQLDKSGGHLLFNRSLAPTFMSVLNPNGALKDTKTRAALQASIDYAGIQKSVYLGTGTPLRGLVPPEAWSYGQDVFKGAWEKLPETKQDIPKAKGLFAEAPSSEPIVLAYNTASAEETRIATVVADGAKKAGLNIKLKPLTAEQGSAVFSSADARKGIDLLMVTGYLDFPDPIEYYAYFTTGNYYNFAGYSNPDYDTAILNAIGTEDPEAKARFVTEAQSIMATDLPTIPITSAYVALYYRQGLAGLAPHQSFLYKPWAARLGGK